MVTDLSRGAATVIAITDLIQRETEREDDSESEVSQDNEEGSFMFPLGDLEEDEEDDFNHLLQQKHFDDLGDKMNDDKEDAWFGK